MQTLLLKLQADVAARKRSRSGLRSLLRRAPLACTLIAVAYLAGSRVAAADEISTGRGVFASGGAAESLTGQIDLQRAYIERLERIQRNSSRFGIAADLAAAIEDIAHAENVDPEIAFRLVQVESEFYARAVSPVGAVGLTQLMPATARHLAPGIERSQLFDRDTNLRLGFRFLRSMIDYYNGDVETALTAYNRGPGIVDRHLAGGQNPDNGYARRVLGR